MSDNYVLSNNAIAALNDHIDTDYFDIVQRNNPLQSLFEFDHSGGKDLQIAIAKNEGVATGADSASVIAAADDISRDAFRVPWVEGMAVGQVSNTDIDVMGNDENSIVDALSDNTSKKMRALATRIERHLAGDGFGTQFIIASHTGGASPYVLTATRPTDLANIVLGMTLVSSVAANSAALDTGSCTVSAIDRDAGTVTVTTSNAWDGTANDNHFVFASLDKKSGSYAKPICGLGLDFWLPLTAPSTDETTICGLDRRTDVQGLSGVRVDARNKNIYASTINTLATLSVNGEATPDKIACNPTTWAALQNAAPPNTFTKEPNGGEFEYGFEVISFQGPTGKVKVYPCWAVREDRQYVLSSAVWKLRSARQQLIFNDARAGRNGLIDAYNASALQLRKKAIYRLTCAYPGANAVMRLA